MANYRAIATGLWSAGATWAGGAVPPDSAGHNIYANTFTVTVDTNINVAILTNSAVTAAFVGGGTSAAAGGTFNLNDGSAIVATSITGPSATSSAATVHYAGSTSASVTASVAITAGRVDWQHAIRHSGTGTLAITGNCNGLGSSGNSGHAVYLSGTGTINITGNLVGGVGTIGVDNLGGTAVVNKSSGAGIINIVSGNVTGGSGASYGIANIAGGAVNVLNGNVTGGAAGSYGIYQTGAGSVSVTGNISASSTTIGLLASAGTVTVNGTFTALNGQNAISYSGQLVRASGSFIYSVNGTIPINAARIQLITTPTLSKTRFALDGLATYVDMYTADNTDLGPTTNNVRSGVTYSGMTGTLAVPLPSQVAVGVPTDNTVGTAALTPAAVWEYATRTLTAGAGISASDVWSHASRTLTSASGPSATDIRQELDSNSTKLANLDATISSRLASSVSTNITAIKAKTDLLNTDRLAQCATTSIVGNLIAQSNS